MMLVEYFVPLFSHPYEGTLFFPLLGSSMCLDILNAIIPCYLFYLYVFFTSHPNFVHCYYLPKCKSLTKAMTNISSLGFATFNVALLNLVRLLFKDLVVVCITSNKLATMKYFSLFAANLETNLVAKSSKLTIDRGGSPTIHLYAMSFKVPVIFLQLNRLFVLLMNILV